MAYAIKAEISDGGAETFDFPAQKTMYGGKHVAAGDTVYLFASETQGGQGLIARGVVIRAAPVARLLARQTPRVSLLVQRTASAKASLGRADLKPTTDRTDEGPASELHFKFYRQATNKLVALSDAAAAFLDGFF